MHEAKEQLLIPKIRSFLKLYTTMSVTKLASFLGMNEDQFRYRIFIFYFSTK